MGTWNAFYIKVTSDDAAVNAAIRDSYPNATVDAGGEFVGVALSPDHYTPPEEILTALSVRLHTDVLWLGFQSSVDAFQFHHWRDGVHMRALVYGCYEEERTWERVEGSAEPWEREVFFEQSGLDSALEDAEPKDKAELKRIWRDADIVAGRTEPALDSRGCAHQIAALCGLPHYDS